MKKTKKLLSALLAVIMILSMIPAVSAQEATEAPVPAYTTNAGGWVEIETASELNFQCREQRLQHGQYD